MDKLEMKKGIQSLKYALLTKFLPKFVFIFLVLFAIYRAFNELM